MQPLLQWKSNMNYIYNEHVCVALVTQHAMHVHHIVTCGLSHSTSFFHITKAAFFGVEGGNI